MSWLGLTAEIAGFGFAFGFSNAIQSRLVNNGTKRRFPDYLVALWVLVVSFVFALAARALAQSHGIADALSYAIFQAAGVVLGTRVANGPLYDRLHPDGKASHDR